MSSKILINIKTFLNCFTYSEYRQQVRTKLLYFIFLLLYSLSLPYILHLLLCYILFYISYYHIVKISMYIWASNAITFFLVLVVLLLCLLFVVVSYTVIFVTAQCFILKGLAAQGSPFPIGQHRRQGVITLSIFRKF